MGEWFGLWFASHRLTSLTPGIRTMSLMMSLT